MIKTAPSKLKIDPRVERILQEAQAGQSPTQAECAWLLRFSLTRTAVGRRLRNPHRR